MMLGICMDKLVFQAYPCCFLLMTFLEHAEKLGLGSMDYQLIDIV